MNIKDFNLTENDFQLIIEGLESLPSKGLAGEMMGELMTSLLSKDLNDDFKKKQEHKKRQEKIQRDALLEDIKILQAKIIILKRYFIEQDGLNQVDNILGRPCG